jgi:hypothetical protein
MKVKLLNPMFWPPGTTFIEPIGKIVDVPDDMAKDWVARRMAEVPPAPAQPQPFVKGKK